MELAVALAGLVMLAQPVANFFSAWLGEVTLFVTPSLNLLLWTAAIVVNLSRFRGRDWAIGLAW